MKIDIVSNKSLSHDEENTIKWDIVKFNHTTECLTHSAICIKAK